MDEVSDSAILRIASRKLGIEPVVRALIRGSVTVGGSAWAVKGYAKPVSILLQGVSMGFGVVRGVHLWTKNIDESVENTKSLPVSLNTGENHTSAMHQSQ